MLNNLIGNNKYLAGQHVTLADFSALPIAVFLQKLNFDLSEFANIKKWMNTVFAEQPHILEIAEKADGFEEIMERFKQIPSQNFRAAWISFSFT